MIKNLKYALTLALSYLLTLQYGYAQQVSSDTSMGYFQIKKGGIKVVAKPSDSSFANILKYDSLGLHLYNKDTSIIKFTNLKNSNESYPVLMLDPITKEVYTRYINELTGNNLPSQENNSGKYLYTDGSQLYWKSSGNLDVANYRRYAPDNDRTIIQLAVNDAAEGDNIYLEDRTYELDADIIVTKSLNFIGKKNTVIKRKAETIANLTSIAPGMSNYIIVDKAGAFRSGDIVFLFKGEKWIDATGSLYVSAIKSDTVFFGNTIGRYRDDKSTGTYEFPINTKVKKSFNLFTIASPGDVPLHTCSFKNITFDGNKDENNSNLGYDHSWAIYAIGKRATTIENCNFINMPTEVLMGHNYKITNCQFNNINGSALHFSINKMTVPENEIYSEITNCIFTNVNLVDSRTITSHSEGVLNTSNSGGYFTATNNKFIDCKEAVIGNLYSSLTPYDHGTNNIIFTNNYVKNVKRLISFINENNSGIIKGVVIDNNNIMDVWQDINYAHLLSLYGNEEIILQGVRSTPGATALNKLASSGASPGQILEWDGESWVPADKAVTDDFKIVISSDSSRYNLTNNESNKIITIDNANLINVELADDLQEGFKCTLVQLGDGQLSITSEKYNILNSDNFSKTRTKFSKIEILVLNNKNVIISGDLSN